ncbi:MAG TPA: 50S ribosomal protein L24 [Candidatus Marinimicrobia bacterium]|jgi:large subunit ribosomal protein L24|nr:50S ribosomal protein L24 [Candidatus Neomarinimicrobiota bacterium]HOO14733.1 50S ribosomal protein L24 [Candidatus Neomarinimicrobiota bacterium]HPB00028.1 50S ribosomal protein L24 [Candidatus Neomarinimicrobiota bacterium]HPI28700.1 50S ribosomal protein L24 [Candidatus Neomarinimicrobiota bacterium]HPN74335.1 50S ribosomal protein L24 [Candidatus Neomarinimicrobiota bacterium]
MLHIRKNDTVMVITGESKGKIGKVLKVFPDKERVIVEGVNFIKRHTRPNQQNPQGGIIEKEAPIHISNVKLVHADQATKVGYRTLKDGKKVRVARETGEIIDAI